MKSRRILSIAAAALFSVVIAGSSAFAADPGLPLEITGEASDQKAGSLLYFNIYTSSATNPLTQNTRISITNTNDFVGVAVHLFFVDGGSCSVADRFVCLTPNQTTTFLTSEQDPGVTGYIVALAVDFQGLPRQFNFLIGDEYVKFQSGHFANLGAEAYSKLNNLNVISTDGSLAAVFFDGLNLAGSYSRVSRVVAVDNIGSRSDGNETLLILNRVGGNLFTTASTLGTLFGILYDDQETAHSFQVTGGCQLRQILSNTFPRTTPRFDVVIPAGQTGWLKIFSTSDIGIIGSVINFNANSATSSGAFNEGRNLHKLRLTSAANVVVPIFPPACDAGGVDPQ
ncbi:MAG: hypothetical protein KF868_11225 [Acidobacteria bacterium]|nr:hypothetical protein [Acidobacteriota bacterium]